MAVKGLIGSSKRVLSGTKNEDKIKAIKEGVQILEDFLERFDRENRSKSNLAYLASSIVTAFPKPSSSLAAEFVDVYDRKAKGNYKHLRTIHPKGDDSKTWDIIRNKSLKKLKEKISANDSRLFREDGSPTAEHLELIYWAYSPQPDKVKSYVEKVKGVKIDKKRKSTSSSGSSGSDESPAKKKRSR